MIEADDPFVLRLCLRLKQMIASCAECRRDPTLACALRTLGRDLPERRLPRGVRLRLHGSIGAELGKGRKGR
ncbi:MAG: hypothetical protein HZB25_00630 [Candidatus Eisenbacteria bacterium]|nr:hypothetical protein [Candidatus Eisenbacteria bacterium]